MKGWMVGKFVRGKRDESYRVRGERDGGTE